MSNALRSLRDYPRVIAAGGTQNVGAPGEFVYCKSADRTVRVYFDGDAVDMQAGDSIRPEQGFRGFDVENLDAENPVAVVFTVGYGSYDRKIIQGEVTVQPGIRRADGSFVTDTRWPLTVSVAFDYNRAPTEYLKGDLIATYDVGASLMWGIAAGRATDGSDRVLITATDDSDGQRKCVMVDGAGDRTATLLRTGYQRVLAYLGGSEWLLVRADGGIVTGAGEFAFLNEVLGYSRPAQRVDALAGRDLKDAAVDPATGNVFVACLQTDNAVLEITQSGELVKEHHVPYDQITNASNGVIEGIASAGPGEFFVSAANGEQVERWNVANRTLETVTTSVPNPSGGAITVSGRRGYSFDNSWQINEWVMVPWTVKGYGNVYPGGCPTQRFASRTANNGMGTEAAVTLTFAGGQTVASGEVLRALLDFAYGGDGVDPQRYLDHVWAVDFRGARNAGIQYVTGGSESFDRANIADDFTITTPATVTITVDNAMPMRSL